MSSLVINLWICGGISAACWLLAELTREYSWTDRIWSIAPIIYAWVFAGMSGDARSILVAVLITLWGARLTFNFARRGGYGKGGEDYRWAVLRERMPRWAYALFNLVFIAVFQNALVLAITVPMWVFRDSGRPLGWWDAVAALVFLGLLAGEAVADQQRWNFHRDRVKGGVLQSGLYRYSRHPNYFFEISQWWVVYAFAVIATGMWWSWTVAGAVALTALFFGSTVFTESISRDRHPEYEEYRRRTSMLVPWWPRRGAGSTT